MNFGIIGAKQWALAMGWLCLQNGHNVLVWENVDDVKNESGFIKTRKNKYADLTKNEKLNFASDLDKVLNFGEYVIISNLNQNVDELMQKIKKINSYENKHYIIATKDIVQSTGQTLSEILIDNGVDKQNICAVVGLRQPQSIVKGEKTRLTVTGYDREQIKNISKALSNEKCKLLPMPDADDVHISDQIRGYNV